MCHRTIHSSDFRSAVTNLGFSFGSDIIQNVLVFCKLNNDGYIDFSRLEEELLREREVYNSFPKKELKNSSSSTGALIKPWRPDVLHQQKISLEAQSKRIQQHQVRINDLYNKLSHHLVSSDDAIQYLQSLEIIPTKEFIKLLSVLEYSHASLNEFIGSLTKSETFSGSTDNTHMAGSITRPKDVIESLGTFKKRSNLAARSAFYDNNNKGINKTSVCNLNITYYYPYFCNRVNQLKVTGRISNLITLET